MSTDPSFEIDLNSGSLNEYYFPIASDTHIANFVAGSHNDVIKGNFKDNKIWGMDGSDTLFGRSGNDIIEGGKGSDHLYGGRGVDTFVFSQGDGTDVIHDFEVGSDIVHLSNMGIDESDLYDLLSRNSGIRDGAVKFDNGYGSVIFFDGVKSLAELEDSFVFV